MIERRLLESYAIVAEGFEEGRQRRAVIRTQVEPPDTWASSTSREVAASSVKIDHLFQRRLAAVMEIRSCKLHVAKRRRHEQTAHWRLSIPRLWYGEGK